MSVSRSKIRYLFSLVFILGALSYGSQPAVAQEENLGPSIQDLIINGGFEGGFQEDFGIGYGWGGFSNGNAVVGWNFDDWDAVVPEGTYAQRIEIRDATEIDRYAGIYQTISVVPGEQYKLTIKGLVRSTEGDIDLSDYGYRIQYAIGDDGGTAWELVNDGEWIELPWDEQVMSEPAAGAYRHETYETTITAAGDKLTIFIRGWKKWINNGSGVFDIDAVSFVGPAPDGFQAPMAQGAAAGATDERTAAESVVTEADADGQASEQAEDLADVEQQTQSPLTSQQEAPAEADAVLELDEPMELDRPVQGRNSSQSIVSVQPLAVPDVENAPLPVSGQGSDDSINYVVIAGAAILLILILGAVTATVRRRHMAQ